jgi:hypothetical protein
MDEHLAKRRRERMRAIIDDAIRRVTAAGERIAREKRERKIVPVTFTPKPVKRKRGRPRKAKVHQFVNGDEE